MTRAISSRQYLQSLTFLFFALLAGQVIFLTVGIALQSSGTFGSAKDLDSVFLYMAPVLVAGGIFAGTRVYGTRLQAIIHSGDILDKQLADYRGAFIAKCALLEGPILFAIIAYLLTGHIFLAGLAAVSIAFFFTYRPTKEKLIIDLKLSAADAAKLNNPDAVVGETSTGNAD